jgi:hypothetical protein
MKTGLVLAVCLLGAGLGGCMVTSDQPLFAFDQAPKHPLHEGLWAVTGPGCDVKPSPAGQPLPECVGETMTVAGARLDWALVGSPIGSASAAALKAATGTTLSASDFVLVDGDPNIIEMIVEKSPFDASAPPMPIPLPGGVKPPAAPGVSYMSLRSLELDKGGRIIRGVLWTMTCPDKLAEAPGFKPSPTQAGRPAVSCVAETPEAVRTQAPHMKPFLSFFVTWVR